MADFPNPAAGVHKYELESFPDQIKQTYYVDFDKKELWLEQPNGKLRPCMGNPDSIIAKAVEVLDFPPPRFPNVAMAQKTEEINDPHLGKTKMRPEIFGGKQED